MVKAEGFAQKKYGGHAGQDAGEDAKENGFVILFQQLDLLVQRHGEANGGRRQEVIDILRPFVVGLVVHACELQESHHHQNRREERIEERKMEFQEQFRAQVKGDEAHEDAEVRRVVKKFVHAPSFFVRHLMTNWVKCPDTTMTAMSATTVITM